jgi:HSP20 family molecular chaperone IbpA
MMRDLVRIENLFDEEFFPDTFFRNLRKGDGHFTSIEQAKITYPMDIYDTDDAKIFELAVLDARVEDICVVTKGSVLTIEYNKKIGDEEKNRKYECKRIAKRAFTYSWKFPDVYCLDYTRVDLNNGILKVTVPKEKKEKLREKRIDINVSNDE